MNDINVVVVSRLAKINAPINACKSPLPLPPLPPGGLWVGNYHRGGAKDTRGGGGGGGKYFC